MGSGIVCWLRPSGICSPYSYEAGPLLALYRNCSPFPGAHHFLAPYFRSVGSRHFTVSSKRREYHADCRSKKAALFFVVCDANPDTIVKIPDAMRIKGYSPSKAANRWLQQQVHCEEDKIKGEAIPGPPVSMRRMSRYLASPPPCSAASSNTPLPTRPQTACGWRSRVL